MSGRERPKFRVLKGEEIEYWKDGIIGGPNCRACFGRVWGLKAGIFLVGARSHKVTALACGRELSSLDGSIKEIRDFGWVHNNPRCLDVLKEKKDYLIITREEDLR